MVNLLKIQKQSTAQAVAALTKIQEPRPYLGASSLGHSCERYLWYAFRWCFQEDISERQARLFGRGHREEPIIIEMLQKVGIQFWGDQDEIVFAHGHAKGHRDGCCLGVLEAPKTPHLAEFKTMNDANFKEVIKSGVQVSKPSYYAQCQIYMQHFQLTRTLFVAINKNTDAAYFERLRIDHKFADSLERKAENIVLSELPPSKRFDPTWFECRWCSANKICHGSELVLQNCRTCQFIDIYPKGQWKCQKYDDLVLATDQQRLGCDKYKLLEGL